MLTVSSSSLTPTSRRPVLFRHQQSTSQSATIEELYRPRTILIEKCLTSSSYGFSIQTYGFASLNPMSTDGSACSLLSLSTDSTASRKSSGTNSLCSASQMAPIQLVTYVDHVQDKSPAWQAGLRAGSVILSVNDQSVEHDDHETLVKRITDCSTSQLKLIVVQQNVNKQIALCEQLQKLHKLLNEKEEEFEELCRQEQAVQGNAEEKVSDSPSPRLQLTTDSNEHSTSFCHSKIPLDWRQSVTNFAHQQKLPGRTLPFVVHSSSTISPTKYHKARSQQHQRSSSLSTIVFHYSKSSHLHQHSSTSLARSRRALSYEELVSIAYHRNNPTTTIEQQQSDESFIASGCSLAMDLSRSFDLKHYSSSSSSSTIGTDDDDDDEDEQSHQKLNQRIQQFKWKLRINP